LVDFSETFGLLIGPFLYLFVLSIAKGPVQWKKIRIHLLFPCIYTFLILPYLLSSEDIKYNAWISSYHPGLPYRQVELSHIPIRFWLTDWHTELVLLSLGVYIVLSGIVIFRSFQEKNESFWRPVSLSLRTMRNGVIQIGAFTILIVIVKLFNEDDTGDHLFAAFGSLLIYVTSISVMRNSGFFKQATLTEAEKYKSSTLTPGQQQSILHKFNQVMQEQKPYLKSSFSLPDLAQQLGVSVHALSQALNHGLGKSFFELVAGYRVEEAKRLLIEQPNIKVEEIAEQVGYNSKSSFNTAFKKFTGSTPSAFREKNS
jgi:AraC-like DNA-binding protein